MDWVWPFLFLVGVTHLTYGQESIQKSVRPSHLVKRNTVSRTSSDDAQRDKESTDEDFPGRVVYHLQDDFRPEQNPSLSFAGGPSADANFETDNYLTNELGSPYQRTFASGQGDTSSSIFGDQTLQPSLLQQWESSVSDDESNNELSNNLSSLNEEERVMLRKRLQMKGMGLLGSKNGGTQSLTGFSKTRPKGLVLSIDLGIKALRDAIMHAKHQQKNRQHQMQAQKNMRLLHNIGKRRVSTALDRL